jgi:hypothetical protein
LESNGKYLVNVLVQAGSVEQTTERKLNARAQNLGVAQSQTTRVVNLGLQESVTVQGVLGTDFQGDSRVRVFVPGSLGTGFDLLADLVVVRGGEDAELVGAI